MAARYSHESGDREAWLDGTIIARSLECLPTIRAVKYKGFLRFCSPTELRHISSAPVRVRIKRTSLDQH